MSTAKLLQKIDEEGELSQNRPEVKMQSLRRKKFNMSKILKIVK